MPQDNTTPAAAAVSQPPPQFTAVSGNSQHVQIRDIYQAQNMFLNQSPQSKSTPLTTWHLPANNQSQFVGRSQELQQLQTLLATSQPNTPCVVSAVSGLGGVGKTELATYYAHNSTQTYKQKLWFQANDPKTLEADYRAYGLATGILIQDSPKEATVEIIRNHLAQHPGWLIIYDNAPNQTSLENLLPHTGGHMLITTRQQDWSYPKLDLDCLSPEEAIALLKHSIGPDKKRSTWDETSLVTLANTLGFLPLALAQAGAYLKHNPQYNLNQYLSLYEAQRLKLLNSKQMPAGKHHQPVAITYQLARDDLSKQHPQGIKLLEALSCLADTPIPRSLILTLLQSLTVSELDSNEAISTACDYSLLKQSSDGQTLNMHTLIQTVIYQSLTQEQQIPWLGNWLTTLNNCYDAVVVEDEDNPQLKEAFRQQARLHSERLDTHLKKHTNIEFETDWASLLFHLSNTYSDLGDAATQKALLQRALKIEERHYGPEHLQVTSTLVNLATAEGALGGAATKKALLQHALKIQERHDGPEHWQVAATLGNLATAEGDLGDAATSKALLQRALKIKERHYGAEHWQVASTLVNLANAEGALGNAVIQKALLQRALQIQERHYGTEHWQVARTLANLAIAESDLGDAATQKVLLQRALKIQERHYGSEHFQVAITLVNLANAEGALGDAATKKALLQRALKIQERHYGAEHWQVVSTLVNLTNAEGALGNAATKKDLLRRALPILERHYGADHWRVAITLLNLANAYESLNKLPLAIQTMQRAYNNFLNHRDCGPNHPHTQKAKRLLQQLETRCPSQPSQPQLEKQLRSAAAQNNLNSLKALLQQVKQINACDLNPESRRTALHWAAIKGYSDCVTALLETGASFTILDAKQQSAFQYAQQEQHQNIVTLFLKQLTQKYKLTDTSQPQLEKGLRMSAHNGYADDLRFFIQLVDNINAQDSNPNSQQTALHRATIKNHTACMQILKVAGAKTDIPDAKGKTAVDYTAATSASQGQRLFDTQTASQTPAAAAAIDSSSVQPKPPSP